MAATIAGSVGRNANTGANGANRPDDVRIVQTLLRLAFELVGVPSTRLRVDGIVGPATVGGIVEFQNRRLGFADGLVDPNGRTLAELNAVAGRPLLRTIQAGDTSKSDPYTIAFIANPTLEAPWNSGAFATDPIMTDPDAFDACVSRSGDALFARLAGQGEALLSDPAIGPRIRVLSVFQFGRELNDASALAAQDGVSNMLIARRQTIADFLTGHAISADVAFVVSKSATHDRASAWFTTDNDAGPGTAYALDGVARSHRHYCLIPGTVALPATATSITALHEFGHAASSYSNGSIVDQYVDSPAAINVKRGRPIPDAFAEYDGTLMASDKTRDGLGYPNGWQSYHCELLAASYPSVMDDYWQAAGGQSQACAFDRITRQYLRDRLLAKLSR